MVNVTSFWLDRPVLVTGATGLVGSWLVKDLVQAGAKVSVFVLDADPQTEFFRSGTAARTRVINGDLADAKAVERAITQSEADTIFHLGAQTIVGTAARSPWLTFETNIRGTYNVLEVCRLNKDLVKRILIASSDKAYGTAATLPYREDFALQGVAPYEVSKSCADLLAQSYAHTYGLPVVIVRCGNIFGGGDLNFSRLVPGTIQSFLKGQSPLIRSNGQYIRDYVYVQNVAQVYRSLAEHLEDKRLAAQAFNYSDNLPMTVLALVDEIAGLMDCRHIKPTVLNIARGEIPSQYLSSDKLRRAITLAGVVDLQTGLAETIAWYREFFKL